MKPKTVTEKAFRQQVRDLARLFGWKDHFTWVSIHSTAGFPDLVLCRGRRLIHTELKTEAGKLTEAQRGWLYALASVPGEVYVWRPSCWNQIQEVLR